SGSSTPSHEPGRSFADAALDAARRHGPGRAAGGRRRARGPVVVLRRRTARGRRLINLRRSLLLGTAPPPAADHAVAAALVAGPAGKWFHRADCLLAENRGWATSTRSQHEAAGRRACPGCRP